MSTIESKFILLVSIPKFAKGPHLLHNIFAISQKDKEVKFESGMIEYNQIRLDSAYFCHNTRNSIEAVSYTHLTLPTIYSV